MYVYTYIKKKNDGPLNLDCLTLQKKKKEENKCNIVKKKIFLILKYIYLRCLYLSAAEISF